MKVIIHQGLKELAENKKAQSVSNQQIGKYVKNHRYFNRENMKIDEVVNNLREKLKQKNSQANVKLKLDQLALYFKRENNKSMFEIYEIVLKNPQGVTYRQIEKKTKLQIVNISHYCCRLRKMNFVQLRHEKSEKVVYPKEAEQAKNEEQDEKKEKNGNIGNNFFFHELSLVDNIWINVSSVDAFYNNGITNEEIKEKVGRPSEVKLMMKMVQNTSKMYQFNKEMISEGKVFQHKYKNVPEKLKNQLSSQKEEEKLANLDKNIQIWLKNKFPHINNENFLWNFINEEIKSYYSVSGIKSVNKRTCTPIKLARYITILNYLNHTWPEHHNNLKKLIIQQQKIMQNGIIHKRSIIGILEGLVDKGILRKVEEEYYPEWQPIGKAKVRDEIEEEQLIETKPRKKVHLSSIKKSENSKEFGIKMKVKDYEKELRIKYLFVSLETLFNSKMKKAFKRILFPRRVKGVLKQYEPQTHLLRKLEDPTCKLPSFSSNNYADLIDEIDYYVEKEGQKEEPHNINLEVSKIFHRFPERNEEHLKLKFGNSWRDKLQDLLQKEILVERGQSIRVNSNYNGYLV